MRTPSDEPDTGPEAGPDAGSSSEPDATTGIGDDQLPEDLRPDASPLAAGLEPGETAGDLQPGELLEEGKTAVTSQGLDDTGSDTGSDTGGVDTEDGSGDADSGG